MRYLMILLGFWSMSALAQSQKSAKIGRAHV